MQTRTGIKYGESDTKSTFEKGGAKKLLQKVEKTPQTLDFAPPLEKVELKVDIDFDAASTAWKLNKKSSIYFSLFEFSNFYLFIRLRIDGYKIIPCTHRNP